MSYFKTSYETLLQVAATGRFEDVAGFLVIARHASGRPVAGFEPYKLSGAGVNSVHEKAGVSEETARGVIERLKEIGVIKPAKLSVKQEFAHARWELSQGELNLDLPHSFIDQKKIGESISPIKRIKTVDLKNLYSSDLKEVSNTELRLDVLMMMINIYHQTNMERFGGLSPKCIFRKWEVRSRTSKDLGIRWGAEPANGDSVTAYHCFIKECVAHIPKKEKKKELSKEHINRFWNAWFRIKELGLVYEAVTLFDVDPELNDKAVGLLTLRVNDFHAGSISKNGDPSLLREFEVLSGTKYAYYTNKDNESNAPEAMWVILPFEIGALAGVWRPRFRPDNKDVGAWLDKEKFAIKETINCL